MDSMILAGGYARRLAPTTDEIPKPLLPVVGRPVLSYTMEKLGKHHRREGGVCYLTVSKKHEIDFANFLDGEDLLFPVKIIAEPSTDDGNKPGTIGAIERLYEMKLRDTPNSSLLVVAGDGISSLDLEAFFEAYETNPWNSLVALFDIGDAERARRYGCAKIDNDGRITELREKPETAFSSLVNTTNFILTHNDLVRIAEYMHSKEHTHMGLIDWLLAQHVAVNGFVFDGYWFDIGDHNSLAEANRIMRERLARAVGDGARK